MIKIVEYILFYLFIPLFLSTLVFFDLIQRLAVPFGQKIVDQVVFCFNLSILTCLRIVGCRLIVKYSSKLPSEGPAIIVSNHQSMFDIPSIHFALRPLRPRFVSKKELGQGIPGVSTCLRVSHAALIDRTDANQALAEIEKFGKFIKKEKVSGVIFPEGTRARDGQLKPFKKRGVETLLQGTFPCWVIPVALDNSWKLQAKKRGPMPLGVKIKMNVCDPIFVSDPCEIRGIAENIQTLIAKELDVLRTLGIK